MPGKRFEENSLLPFHITARCINKEWFEDDLESLWTIFENYLHFIHYSYGLRIHSFVLMRNHWHLIARAPRKNLSKAMQYFMRETSRSMTRNSGRINQTYGRRFHRSLLVSPLYYLHAYKYVYRNPVEAGVVDYVEDYSFTTLAGKLGLRKLTIPVEPDEPLFGNLSETLSWLNRKPKAENREMIRKALKRPEFALAKSNDLKKQNELIVERY